MIFCLRRCRLAAVTNAIGFVVQYAYDVMDRVTNISWRTEDGDTITYTLGVGDRLASWTGGAYAHDIAGNVVDLYVSPSATALSTLRYRFQGREWSVGFGGA